MEHKSPGVAPMSSWSLSNLDFKCFSSLLAQHSVLTGSACLLIEQVFSVGANPRVKGDRLLREPSFPRGCSAIVPINSTARSPSPHGTLYTPHPTMRTLSCPVQLTALYSTPPHNPEEPKHTPRLHQA